MYLNILQKFCSNPIQKSASVHLRQVERISSFNSRRIEKRYFALKLHSQFVSRTNKLSENVKDYLLTKNAIKICENVEDMSNIYDMNDAVKQFQSVIYHSLQPTPDVVIKLFTLYANCNKTVLYRNLRSGDYNTVFVYRVQSSLPHMDFDELHHFSLLLSKLQHIKSKVIQNISRGVFEESVNRAEQANDFSEVLKLFLIGLELYGNIVSTKPRFLDYLNLFNKFVNNATPQELIQILYILGLSQKNGNMSYVPLLVERLLSNFDKISFVDAGLAVSGLFRLGYKSDDSILVTSIAQKLTNTLNSCQNNNLNLVNLFSLVSLIKYLRFCLYKHDIDLINSLKKYLMNIDQDAFNPQFVCHTAAFFANCNHYDHQVFTLLENVFAAHVMESEETVRIKDISRMLWALSHVQHSCNQRLMDVVVYSLEKFCQSGDLLPYSSHVCDSALALCALGNYNRDLIKLILQPHIVQVIQDKNQVRYLSRFLLLNEVYKTLTSNLLPLVAVSPEELPKRSITDEFIHRPCINRLKKAVRWLEKECGCPVFDIRFLVPHINHCSVVLNECPEVPPKVNDVSTRIWSRLKGVGKAKIAVDVNDANTSLFNINKPMGLEALKRNLLQMQGWQVKVLASKEIENCNDDAQALAALLMATIQ